MHSCSVQIRYSNPTRVISRAPCPEKWVPLYFSGNYSFKVEESGFVYDITHGKRKSPRRSVLKAMGKKNSGNSPFSSSDDDDLSTPEGDHLGGHNPTDGKKSSDSASQRPHHVTLDWREFRATLFAREQAEEADSAANMHGESSELDSKPLGLKWAHPISLPETGSVLVATERLDGVKTFQRTVVLLLRSGTKHPEEGPFGIIINRPLNKKIKHMKPQNPGLSTFLADCSLHVGGPLEASMFLVRTGDRGSKIPGFEEVVPGLCYGSRNNLEEAMALVRKGLLKPQDFRFFIGYAGWQFDQLRDEIESGYWHVAACSADLIFGVTQDSSESLWEEILQLMGGQYSELSRKPKQDISDL